MLFKNGLKDLLSKSDGEAFFPHYERMVAIRFGFNPLKVAGVQDGSVWMPYCHHVAHAYAKAFDVEVVNGEKVFITQTRTLWFGHFIRARVSRYAHSWNRLVLPSGKRVILDLFPDETCSMFPIVVLDPHPAYTKHRDGLADKAVVELLSQPYQQERLDMLISEMVRLDKKT